MTVQNAKSQNIFTTQASSDNSWRMIDGKCIQINTDAQGREYFIKGGTEKVYLSEYYEQQRIIAEKARVQDDITNFFSNQIKDFKDWENYYAEKIGKATSEIVLFKNAIKDNNEIVYQNTKLLNPLYEKYDSNNVEDFKGTDKTNGRNWSNTIKYSKEKITDAECRISTRNMFIESYYKLMRNAKFCGDTVQKLLAKI